METPACAALEAAPNIARETSEVIRFKGAHPFPASRFFSIFPLYL
jgi:hypothetical protein